MKKIVLAMMVCLMFAGAGYCAPNHHGGHNKHAIKNPPPPPHHNIISVRRHKHHIPLYPYDRYPSGTQVIINTGSYGISYGVGYGGGYVTYGGSFGL